MPEFVEGADMKLVNPSQPLLFKSSKGVEHFMNSPKIQMTIGQFGASYKKTDSFKEKGWYQLPVAANQGLSECEAMWKQFADVFRQPGEDLGDKPGDMGLVVQVSWLLGRTPKHASLRRRATDWLN